MSSFVVKGENGPPIITHLLGLVEKLRGMLEAKVCRHSNHLGYPFNLIGGHCKATIKLACYITKVDLLGPAGTSLQVSYLLSITWIRIQSAVILLWIV